MKSFEDADARDRTHSTPLAKRLGQSALEVRHLLMIMVASAPPGDFLEIGTSAGYSALWFAFGCQISGHKLITFEILPEKIRKI